MPKNELSPTPSSYKFKTYSSSHQPGRGDAEADVEFVKDEGEQPPLQVDGVEPAESMITCAPLDFTGVVKVAAGSIPSSCRNGVCVCVCV